MRLRSLLFTATLVALESAHAADAPLPKVVATELESVVAMCVEAGGKAVSKDAVTRVDLNGDGSEDYILFVGNVVCDGAASIYGDREKGVAVYAGDGKGGATTVFNGAVYSMTVEGSGADAKLWLGVSGTSCGKKPAKDFASESFCDRPLVWNAKAKTFEFAPVSTVRMVE